MGKSEKKSLWKSRCPSSFLIKIPLKSVKIPFFFRWPRVIGMVVEPSDHLEEPAVRFLVGPLAIETPYLVGGWANPSEKWWTSSVGMMTLPTEWNNKIHVPDHQPEFLYIYLSLSVCRSIYLSINLSSYLYLYLFIYLSLSISLSYIYISISPSLSLSIYLCTYLPIYISIYLSIYLI